MKQVLLLLVLVFLAGTIAANVESAYLFRYLCSDDDYDYYQFQPDKEGLWTFVPQGEGYVIELDYPDKLRTLAWRKPSKAILVYFGLYEVEMVSAGNKVCDDDGQLFSQSVNECLNINPLSLGLPARGLFMVDGNEYQYADNLSFFVPPDAVWHWDLWVDEQLVLSFEQTATEACHVTEVFR